MNAKELFEKSLGLHVTSDQEITGISIDSRRVNCGEVFVAIPTDTDYSQDAIDKGAVCIVQERTTNNEPSAILVDNARIAAARLCQYFYQPIPNTLLAVTGTNGKSSTVSIVSQLLHQTGISTASLGTLGVNVFGAEMDQIDAPNLTTYDAVSLHKILKKLAMHGVSCVAIEATSHGLHQHRLDGLTFHSAALTNVTRDHFDYHKTMDAYIAAKIRLFSRLVNDTAVLNKNSDERFYNVCRQKCLNVLTYGVDRHDGFTDLAIYNHKFNSGKLQFDLRIYNVIFRSIVLDAIGSFQLENLLCALGIVLSAYPSVKIDSLVSYIPQLTQIPGRMERVAEYNEASIFVDFCHTPDALQRVLTDLNAIPHKSLIVVFGCGGDRDKGKRQQMGIIAGKLADKVIITDDNPRFENPSAIRKDITRDIVNFTEIPNRKNAITHSIANLKKGDILLIAGRGNESFQKIMDEKIPLKDKDCVLDAIQGFGYAKNE
ncbi:MAG: UDP-N-acetylmuramoyl-L-alanyl-D-glutamate--2,6-diaminopimelate ligase [Holosporales bacterium]|jgi:UDP-N-acetylmuramoyl-L-alanyl-D-glutamate--2,6-diaminopimelate ligase|nr:UDP-N-acetylmuramoyl-L-alanyl-D-glutamate--2,6-diaminopimelate ligase [Holosporales bacterium]